VSFILDGETRTRRGRKTFLGVIGFFLQRGMTVKLRESVRYPAQHAFRVSRGECRRHGRRRGGGRRRHDYGEVRYLPR